MPHVSEKDMAAVNAAVSKSFALPPWARGRAVSPVRHEFERLFPKKNHFVGFAEMSDEEYAKAELADIEQDMRVRILAGGLDAQLLRHDQTLRLPRPDAGKYSVAFLSSLPWTARFGADETLRRTATYAYLANLRLTVDGAFEKQADDTETALQED